ncbi:unnamed protein product [Paramecium sonneborni]|uniref:EGF-like domain-containing protein n=1 Tax=Paramecium sonneborni TaxID=65129 RepID=A0A8S1R1G3_9CILI|nr:unnamed protein product [Paramecium sonneborni]
MIIFYILFFEQLILPSKCKYLVLTDLTNESVDSLWSDETLSSQLQFCINGLAEKQIGLDTSSNTIYWKRTFSLPKTSRVYVYFEFSLSGNWNNDELQIFANDLKVYSEKFKLEDSNRGCLDKFKYESQAYFVINMRLDSLKFEIKISTTNLGIYIKNIVLLQQQQRGRNEILEFIDYIPTCSSDYYFQQYFCKCKNNLVYEQNSCRTQCSQNYLYDATEKVCYAKDYCTACQGTQTTLVCNTDHYKYHESNIVQSNCVKRCPNNYFQDENAKTCVNMQSYLQTNLNGGEIVDHYYFFTTVPEFLHFYMYNHLMVTVISIPEKTKERGYFYYGGRFYIGSFDSFQSQKVQITQNIQNSQHKIRFRAIAHFIDFNPTKFDITINNVKQTAATLTINSVNRLQSSKSDYIAYLDYTWVRTEQYPLTQNTILFEIEQPQQAGQYVGIFYLDEINIYQFQCQAGCNSCFTYNLCTPCLFPANKDPANCQCLTGYVMKDNQCIVCPTYCTTCVTAGVCVDCQVATKRINSPSCDQCPVNYYLDSGKDNCQDCQTGCHKCTVGTACVQCANGYFRNQTNQCITQCPDGQFNDSSDTNDPKCSICDSNCKKCQTLSTTCTACNGLAILVSGHCYLCSEGQYLSGTTCVPCISGCQICSTITCTTCQDSFYYKSSTNECLSICDPGFYGNATTKTCDQCNSSCLTCLAGTNKDCVTCPPGKVLNLQDIINGECQTNCLVGFYKVDDGCAKCWKGCSACMDSTQACLTCASKFYRLRTTGWCYETCPNGFYNNQVGFVCSPCNTQCKTCNGFSESHCLSCNAPLAYYQNQCLVECYDGYGSINNVCESCAANCKKCFGTLPNQCLECMTGFYTLNNQCYVKCPKSFIGIRPQYVCKCIYDNCISCTASQFFLDNQCYAICPTGYFGYNGLCIKCDVTCGTCFGEGIEECSSCNNGLILFKNTCITNCLGNLYHDVVNNECKTCHIECIACTGPNDNNCTACPSEKLLTIENTCKDQCTDGSYPVLNEKRCYACNPTCKTCFGPSDENCLTCNNLFQANKCVSNCSPGFTINATGTKCDSDFPLVIAICSYQCSTCELAPRFCKLCNGNRSPNPPNCDCEAGYFDDGVNAICPKCANKCLTCKGLANLCLKCKGDRLLPQCNCPDFYYDDGEAVNCVKCQDNCKTCDANGCTSCLGDRINVPSCVCPDGYFDNYETYCQQCAKKCTTCNGSAELCTNCSGLRVNKPICNCPNGYFENSDLECQQCDSTCKDCNQYGCLSCFGNRIGPISGECKCDAKGISRFSIGSVYCTDCSLGVPYFGLIDKFDGFTIDFGGSVALYDSLTGDSDSLCSIIFDEDTLALLGTDPVCNEDFTVIFGDNPTIKVGDKIQLKTEFLLQGCSYKFLQILPMELSIPSTIDQTTHKPTVRFTDTTSPNVCQQLSIKFEELFYNGKQKLKIISWSQILPVTVDPIIAQILSSNTLNNSDVITFPDRLFQSGILYKFGATIESFAKLQNIQTFQFQAQQQSTITFKQDTLISQYNRFSNIKIPNKISYANCIEKNPPEQSLYYEIILKNTKQRLQNGTLTENLIDGFEYDVELDFAPFYFNFTNPYILVFNTKLSRADYTATSQSIFEIYIVPSSPILTIAGGNRMLGFSQELFLNSTITDKDLTEDEASKIQYICYWSCEDIVYGTACQNQMNETLTFDNSCNQFVPARTFAPYKAVNFQVEIIKENVNYSTKVSIQFIELDLPALSIQGVDPLEVHNYYDEFIFKLTYPGINPDVLMYAGAVIYDQVVQATFQFYYLDFKFKIQDYFTNFQLSKGNGGRLRLSVYDPRFIMPSLNTQMLTMNIPPQKCELKYEKKESFVEFLDYLEVNVINCEDDNTPLKYSVMLFPNQSIYKNDVENSKFYHYTLVIPPQQTSKFNLTLPFANHEDSLIVVNIQDQIGGIVNITEPINIKQYGNLSEANIREYQRRLQSFDEQLIGYKIITARLIQLTGLIDYKEELLNELLFIDKNDSFLSNQTETLYHSLSNILSQNVSLIQLNETLLLSQVNYRIKLAAAELMRLTELQNKNILSSEQNIEKTNYVKQYYTYTNILSSYINYRVNKNLTASEIQTQLDAMMNYLQDISVANEPMYKVSSNSVNMNFGFLTSKLANEATGSTIKDSSKNRLLEAEAEADTGNQNYNSSTNFYKFSQTRFIDNPFYSQEGFPKNSSGYQAVDPKLTIKDSTTQSNNITSSMKMKFPKAKELPANTSTKCIAQVDSGSWNADVCKTKKADGETICECESLSPTSIMESLDYLLDKASQVYSLDTLLAFASFPFYKTIVFYFYLFMTGGYAYVVYWGMKVDHVYYTKLAAEKEAKEALEKQLKEEEEKLKEQEQKLEEFKDKEHDDDAIRIEQIDTQNDANQSKMMLDQQEFNDVRHNYERGNTIFNRNKGPKSTQVDNIIGRDQAPTLVEINEKAQLLQPKTNSTKGGLQVINDNTHVAVDVQKNGTNSQISPENQAENQQNSPLKQNEIEQQNPQEQNGTEQNPKEQNPQEKKESEDMVQQSISKIKAYIEYLKYFHQILSIVYKDDEDKPRGLRASIVYTSIMGSLAVLFVFGQPNNISLTLTLALLTAPVNKIYQVALEKMLVHKKKSVRIGGAVVMIVTAAFISYTMLAGLVLSGSVETANQWSYIFIGTFSADNILYSPMQLVLQYGVHMGLINMPIIQKLLNKLLDQKAKDFLKRIFTRRR